MKTKFKLENPDEMDATLTVTMSLGDWKRLSGQLSTAWPSSKLEYAIADVLRKAQRTFEPSPKDPEE